MVSTQMLLTFHAHGFVDQDPDQLRQGIQSFGGDLFQ
jgi:hypothetical protein